MIDRVYEDLDRPPLRPLRVRPTGSALAWRVEVLASTTSTNAVVAGRAAAGEPAGLVVVAEHQTAGRGRLDRAWVSPPRAGLTLSALVPSRSVWVPLWGGLAVARALREQTGVDAVLKWPNDVLVDGRKVCGVLAEVVGDQAVLGIGLNVTTRREELPRADATSLALEGATTTDRDTVLRAVLRALGDVLAEASPDGYRALCSTIGRPVRLAVPDGRVVQGTAEAVDDEGRLVVGGTPFAAGDVVHAAAGHDRGEGS